MSRRNEFHFLTICHLYSLAYRSICAKNRQGIPMECACRRQARMSQIAEANKELLSLGMSLKKDPWLRNFTFVFREFRSIARDDFSSLSLNDDQRMCKWRTFYLTCLSIFHIVNWHQSDWKGERERERHILLLKIIGRSDVTEIITRLDNARVFHVWNCCLLNTCARAFGYCPEKKKKRQNI